MNYKLHYFLFLFLVQLSALAHAQLSVPEHQGVWVRDEAGVLSQQTKQQLNYVLQRHRDSTSNQIAIYIIPTLKGEVVDDYAERVFQKWQLGEKEKDNGVLMLIALEERKVRIEVGYGLEGVLTDLMSSRIIRNEIGPHFKQGDYDGGVKAAVLAVIQTIQGEYVNESPAPRKRSQRGSPLFTILIILFILFFFSKRRGGRGGGGYWSSGRGWMGPMGGFGSTSGSWGGGGGFTLGGGGRSGGGGASGSW